MCLRSLAHFYKLSIIWKLDFSLYNICSLFFSIMSNLVSKVILEVLHGGLHCNFVLLCFSSQIYVQKWAVSIDISSPYVPSKKYFLKEIPCSYIDNDSTHLEIGTKVWNWRWIGEREIAARIKERKKTYLNIKSYLLGSCGIFFTDSLNMGKK